jgi:hypothetical protein
MVVAYMCARVALGRWPVAWQDDPKEINDPKVIMFCRMVFMLTQYLRFAFYSCLGALIVDGALIADYRGRLRRFLCTLGIAILAWGGVLMLMLTDPLHVFRWFID